MLERDHIVEVARSWLGVPYRHQGRRKDRCVDCVGLIIGVGQELGLQLIAPVHYAASPASNLVLKYADDQLVRVENKEFAPGRIAIMWGFDRNEAQHLGVIAKHGGAWTIIHAFSRTGKVVETRWDTFWEKRLVRVYEFPGTRPLEAANG